MHLHLVQFQILERQGFDLRRFLQGKLEFVGTPRPPAANEAGWKDTAVVNPRDVLTILVRFEGYTGRYVFHCHMLEHEDNDMMRPYEVVAADHSRQSKRERALSSEPPTSMELRAEVGLECTSCSPSDSRSPEPAESAAWPTEHS